ACSDAYGRESTHYIGCILDVDVVQLHVLARGDVANSVGVFLSHVGEGVHLIRVQAAEGDLDALHARRIPDSFNALRGLGGKRQLALGDAIVSLPVVITLAIGTAT